MGPSLLIFASGTPDGGGSGFARLVGATRTTVLNAQIVGVVSNHKDGGVAMRANNLGIPFIHMPPPYGAAEYQELVSNTGAEYVALSGWLKKVSGLDPRTTFNIHPAPLPMFGGVGMYGDAVHEAVLAAYRRGEINHSAVSMHFVTDEIDGGPVFFMEPVRVEENDTVETLRARVHVEEHRWQAMITDMVLAQEVYWDGKDPRSLVGSMVP